MPTFRSRHRSVVTVAAPPDAIWQLLTDPERVVALTPLVKRISGRRDVWRLTLAGVSRLGYDIAPSFTERMTFVQISRIEFHHDPPPGRHERIGIDGTSQITRVGETASKMAIDLTLSLELPLPELARTAVERLMARMMRRTGRGVVGSMHRELGIDPDAAVVRVIDVE